MTDTKTTTPEPLPLLAVRQASWGHWGICFFWAVPDAYAPARIEGTLYFPCGPQGPQDGFVGSREHQRYADAVKVWREQGTLPEGLVRR
jgi:hypothetical protein